MSEIPFFASRAAFAMRVGQLSTMLYEQMETCLVSHGLRLPGYTTSIVQTLYHGGDRSISELAQGLKLSHQLASQRVKWLVGEGFATMDTGTEDRRMRVVRLSRKGRGEARKLQEFLPRLQAAYSDMFEEIGLDVHRAVVNAAEALTARPLAARLEMLTTFLSRP